MATPPISSNLTRRSFRSWIRALLFNDDVGTVVGSDVGCAASGISVGTEIGRVLSFSTPWPVDADTFVPASTTSGLFDLPRATFSPSRPAALYGRLPRRLTDVCNNLEGM